MSLPGMFEHTAGKQMGRRRGNPVAALLLLGLLLCAAGFAALGVWQVKRLAWKQALIAHVEAATHAAPVDGSTLSATPAPTSLADLEYRRVALAGTFDRGGTTLVAALTDYGNGYWAMVPLRLANGRAIWVNRGFVAQGTKRDVAMARTPAGPVHIVGLVRRAEPGRTWLRANHPEADRWYYRDLSAIAAARGIAGSGTAWFIDAEADAAPPQGAPIAGLTVLQFPNSHLSYALTWFALCGLTLFGMALVVRQRR